MYSPNNLKIIPEIVLLNTSNKLKVRSEVYYCKHSTT